MFINSVKIVSDGTSCGTKVVTKGGEEIVCKSIRFQHNRGEIPVVTLELIGVPVEVDLTKHEVA